VEATSRRQGKRRAGQAAQAVVANLGNLWEQARYSFSDTAALPFTAVEFF
jgi:hypothetical protein